MYHLWSSDMQHAGFVLLHDGVNEHPARPSLMSHAPCFASMSILHGSTFLGACHSLFELFLDSARAGSTLSSSLAVRHGQALHRISKIRAEPGLQTMPLHCCKTCS